MKSSILRASNLVEPQTRPAPVTPPGPTLLLGLDVHNPSIGISIAPSGQAEVRHYGIIGGTHDVVLEEASSATRCMEPQPMHA